MWKNVKCGRNVSPLDLNICVKVENPDNLLSLSLTKIRMSIKNKKDIKSLPLPQKAKDMLHKFWIL